MITEDRDPPQDALGLHNESDRRKVRIDFEAGRATSRSASGLFRFFFMKVAFDRPLRIVSRRVASRRVASDRVASDRVASRDFRRRFPCFVLNVEFRMQRQQS